MPAINELDAFCIAMPCDVSPFAGADNQTFMAAVLDEHVGHHTLDANVPVHPSWLIVRQICLQRAVLSVDRSLLANGKPISPEAYIARWRTRLASPVPLSRLALDKGLRAVAVFQWRHSQAIAARTAQWVNPPYACFGDLLTENGFTTESVPARHPELHLSTLKVDLAANNGARIAWWADDFLSSSAIAAQVVSRRVELHRVPFDAKPASFHSAPATPVHQGEPAHL